MRRSLGLLCALASALVFGPLEQAAAAASGAATCQASQLQAAGRMLQAELRCFAGYYKDGAVDSAALDACRDGAVTAFQAAYASSLAAAGANICALDDPVGSVVADLEGEVDALVAAISGGFTDSGKAERTLHAALLNATGSALAGALGAESKDAKKGDEPKRLSARSKAREKLLSSFAKALAKAEGVPPPGLSADGTADEVDRIADELSDATAPTSYAVSGTIHAADGSFVDSDVNDTNTNPASNDTAQTAQEIPVPAALGGYVNRPGAGPAGNSQEDGDVSDVFRVSLAAGQRINLRFADPVASDLDLCLYDGDANLLGCSEGVSETEELFAPTSGEFLVEVFPFFLCNCGSSYVLTLGQTLASAGPNGVRLSDEFVPGELIVTLDAKAARLASGPPAAAAAFEASFGMQALGGAADREMLFRATGETARAATLEALDADPARAALEARYARLSEGERAKLDTILAMKALRRRPDVASIDLNYVRRAQVTPNDTHFGLQWHYPLINLPAAWDLTTGSDAVEVAVIDTGALFGHPDLAGQLSSAFDFDFVSDPSRAGDGGGIDNNAEDPGDGGGAQPSSFHGTHVAGTIGASTNNGDGVAGVAWDVTLIPVRVLGRAGGTSFDVIQGVRYAAGLANNSGSTHLVDVINLSLGGGGFSASEQSVFNEAHSNGVIVIAAAGNNNSSQLSYPASYDGVVSVSAVETRRQKAPYSNFGSAVDVAAPGGDSSADRNGDGFGDGVLSTAADDSSGLTAFNVDFMQGTSMASPHVAGVAALMKAVDPTLTPAEFDSLLSNGALTNDLGTGGRDDIFGHGLIDARKAVEAAGAIASDDPILLVSPTSLSLGTALTTASFQVSNGGGGTLTVSNVSETEPWLSVSPSSGLGTYTVTVSRTGLADGTYTGSITVTSSDGNATVSVVMSVLAGADTPNAGFHYVLVIDPESFEAVAQVAVEASDGDYPYALAEVPSGTYLLYAGSDTDNDFFICGTGEACGAYPTLGLPELIEITGARSGLDFVSGFLQTLGTGTASAGEGTPPEGLRRSRGRRLAP